MNLYFQEIKKQRIVAIRNYLLLFLCKYDIIGPSCKDFLQQ